MTREDIAAGRLVKILEDCDTGYRQPIHAVYYRNTQLSRRISCFLEFSATEVIVILFIKNNNLRLKVNVDLDDDFAVACRLKTPVPRLVNESQGIIARVGEGKSKAPGVFI